MALTWDMWVRMERWVITSPGEGFPGGSGLKNPPAKAGDTGWILGLGRSHCRETKSVHHNA